jgi:hypothetical protein
MELPEEVHAATAIDDAELVSEYARNIVLDHRAVGVEAVWPDIEHPGAVSEAPGKTAHFGLLLDYDDPVTALGQPVRERQSGDAGPDDDGTATHRRLSSRTTPRDGSPVSKEKRAGESIEISASERSPVPSAAFGGSRRRRLSHPGCFGATALRPKRCSFVRFEARRQAPQ